MITKRQFVQELLKTFFILKFSNVINLRVKLHFYPVPENEVTL
jgi:hypothetical protein